MGAPGGRDGRVPTPRQDLRWVDVAGLAVLDGIGFGVSLLVGDLGYGDRSERDEHVKVAVLVGSLAAALVAAVILRLRDRTIARL